MSNSIRFLSAKDVKQALSMQDAIAGMKSAYGQLSGGKAVMPLRSRVHTSESDVTLLMPAYLQDTDNFGIKIVSVFPNNGQLNLPMIHALVLAIDSQTGQPLAILEGDSLTAIRTGAGAGAATDLLARDDAKTVAIIGSGVQARTQLEAVCTVREIEQVWVYSPNREHAEAFVEAMAGHGVIPDEIVVSDDADSAVEEADIVCTATSSMTPVFDGNRLKSGTHINAVGSYMPTMQEVDATTIQRALVVVDSREASLAEAGDLVIPLEAGLIDKSHIVAELGELVNGTKTGRQNAEQITYFKSVGVAVQDAISAGICLRNAEEQGLGVMLDLLGE